MCTPGPPAHPKYTYAYGPVHMCVCAAPRCVLHTCVPRAHVCTAPHMCITLSTCVYSGSPVRIPAPWIFWAAACSGRGQPTCRSQFPFSTGVYSTRVEKVENIRTSALHTCELRTCGVHMCGFRTQVRTKGSAGLELGSAASKSDPLTSRLCHLFQPSSSCLSPPMLRTHMCNRKYTHTHGHRIPGSLITPFSTYV
jgi:hypothetical protein